MATAAQPLRHSVKVWGTGSRQELELYRAVFSAVATGFRAESVAAVTESSLRQGRETGARC